MDDTTSVDLRDLADFSVIVEPTEAPPFRVEDLDDLVRDDE